VAVTPGVAGIGETLSARFAGEETELEVVGHAAVPRAGAMLTFETLQRLAPETARQVALIRLAPGADPEAFAARVKEPPLRLTDQDIEFPDLPDDLVNFGRVDTAPAAVAGAMGLVAVATLVHALTTTVRRRRRELAVLRTLGFTGRQVLGTMSCQATVLVALALIVGLPVGVVAGRLSWLVFAGELEVVPVAVVPLPALVLATIGAVILANAVALLAGVRASRASAAAVLRSE
jgi:predicted lysophospholipase L1 biosynthesis ABC-type transport system permease subunit